MTSKATTVEAYIQELTEDRKTSFIKLRQVVLDNLPHDFEEMMNYGMPGIAVPHRVFPDGYHCKPSDPLPFMGYASQKNSINFYHMGIYANEELMTWFINEYPKHSSNKLDMGKSCMRFKKLEHIPFELIGELVKKMSAQDWIDLYQEKLDNRTKKK